LLNIFARFFAAGVLTASHYFVITIRDAHELQKYTVCRTI